MHPFALKSTRKHPLKVYVTSKVMVLDQLNEHNLGTWWKLEAPLPLIMHLQIQIYKDFLIFIFIRIIIIILRQWKFNINNFTFSLFSF